MGSSSSSSRNSRRHSQIRDDFLSIDHQVTAALSKADWESSNPIVVIDVTKSNEWTGERSFNKKSLHDIGPTLNPYEHAISIIAKTYVKMQRVYHNRLSDCVQLEVQWNIFAEADD